MTKTWIFTVFLAFASVGPVSEVQAARGTPCNSCEECSQALALPMSRVYLVGDLVAEGDGPCLVIRGIGAQFDGMERDLRPVSGKNTVGVIVESPNVLVKNLHIIGTDTGVRVSQANHTTLYNLWVEAKQVGVDFERCTGPRLTRSAIKGGKVGVDIGSRGDGECSPTDATQQSVFGAVISGTDIREAEVGVAACSGIPVLHGNVITNNNTGVQLAHPASSAPNQKAQGPYDTCACAPTLPGATPGSTLFYSSGCHGCKVHEEWLPELRKNGNDIILRASGPGTQDESKVFDGHIDRCAPQISDVIGLSGCVPNYACISNDASFKVRAPGDSLAYESEIQSAESLEVFAKSCQSMAAARFKKGDDCVKHQLSSNDICGNKTTDIVAASTLSKWPGIQNACGSAKGFNDKGSSGCSRECAGSY